MGFAGVNTCNCGLGFFECYNFSGHSRYMALLENYRYFLQFCFLSILKKHLMSSRERIIYFCIYRLEIISLILFEWHLVICFRRLYNHFFHSSLSPPALHPHPQKMFNDIPLKQSSNSRTFSVQFLSCICI